MNELKAMDKSRIGYLDILRGFGIIFIVIGHITYDRTVLKWLYSFHVPLFFFAAGAVYKKRPVAEDIKRRSMTVLVPYFFFGTAELIYWQLLERRFRPSQMSFGDSVLGLIFGQYDYLDFNSHLWFLPCFFVTVVFYNAVVNDGGKKFAYAVCAVISVISVFCPMPEMLWGLNRLNKYIGFYAVGNLVSDIGAAEKTAKQNKILTASAAVLLLAASGALSYSGLVHGGMFFVTASVGIGGVFLVSLLIGECRPLQYIGRISLVILCIHGAVYRILLKLLSLLLHTDTDTVREKLYWAIPVAALTLAVCAGVYEIIIRVMPIVIGKKRAKKSGDEVIRRH